MKLLYTEPDQEAIRSTSIYQAFQDLMHTLYINMLLQISFQREISETFCVKHAPLPLTFEIRLALLDQTKGSSSSVFEQHPARYHWGAQKQGMRMRAIPCCLSPRFTRWLTDTRWLPCWEFFDTWSQVTLLCNVWIVGLTLRNKLVKPHLESCSKKSE